MAISASDIPNDSEISKFVFGADFYDSYNFRLSGKNRTAVDIWLSIIQITPPWVDILMLIRNRVVQLFGLKNLGLNRDVENRKYSKGDRVGIFTVFSISDDEIILTDDDKHLNVKISLCRFQNGDSQKVHVSTVVHTYNILGRFYMLFVKPFHRVIVRSMLSKAEKILNVA